MLNRLHYKIPKTKVILCSLIFTIVVYLSIRYFRSHNVHDNIEAQFKKNQIQNVLNSTTVNYYDSIMFDENRDAVKPEKVSQWSLKQKSKEIISELRSGLIELDEKNMKSYSENPNLKIKKNIEIKNQPIINSQFCGNGNLVLVAIMSTARNVAHRNAIRHTWGNFNKPFNKLYKNSETTEYRILFIIGRVLNDNLNLLREISDEMLTNNDIIELDFPDSEYEYTRKFIALMEWLQFNFCVNLRFVLRVLDNVFINIPSFMIWLNLEFIESKKSEKIYLGNLIKQDEPIRNPQHPFYIKKEEYPENYFPNYIQSPIYLLSKDTISCMYQNVKNVPIISMEDAFIGLLARKCFIYPMHNEHFVLLQMPENKCHHRKMFFVGNMKPIDELKVFQNLLEVSNNNSNRECEEIDEGKEL